MCGRFLLNSPLVELQRAFRFPERPNLGPRYNVAPTQTIPIIRRRQDGEVRELALMRWGLVPFWAKDLSIGSKMINARAEGIESKSAFRAAFTARRCLVPADGFYEWQKVEGGKQPMLIRLRSSELFAFAGLWETWRGPEGPVETCTIVTTEPNAVTASIHNRMPVILSPTDYDRWLDPSQPGAQELLRPCPDDWLEAYPVSTRVNTPRNDAADLIEPFPNPA
jgi:putative SOS response-associated peptidase YedK